MEIGGSEPRGPLAGLKVVELAHIMAGPACGRLLADMGAAVIKVEKVPGGDDTRRFLPPAIEDQSAAFMMVNANKRGIAVDLKQEAGREILLKLLAEADVVIENYRRGTMDRLGLSYEALRAENPGLIYCEISGFGRSGPYADRAGLDLIAQAMSGLMSITGEGPGRPPVKVGAPITDISAGILGALGVCAAYARRLQTGEGQKVDTSLFEAGILQTFWQSAIALATGVAPGPLGSGHPLNAPYQAFQTADGWITVGAANEAIWKRLLGALEAPALAEDPRFANNEARNGNTAALEAELAPLFAARTSDDWLARLEAAGVPAGPVLDVTQMQRDPQTLAREMLVSVPHATLGAVETLGLPIKFSETPGGVARGAPFYGQDSRAVLAELGYSSEAIDRLAAEGVVVLGQP